VLAVIKALGNEERREVDIFEVATLNGQLASDERGRLHT
jgi:hypothetical protein